MKTPHLARAFTLVAAFCLLMLQAIRASGDPALTPAIVATPKSEADLPAPRDFQGIPGIAVTPKGRLFATWYAGGPDEGPHNYVVLAHSDDSGKTWTPITRTIHHPHPKIRTFDPVLWTDPNGTLHLYYAQASGHWDGRAGTWEMTTANPDAPAPDWTAPRRIADGVMMNKPTVLTDGRWLLPIAIWPREPRQYAPDHALADRNVPPGHNHYDPAKAGTQVYATADHGKTYQLLVSIAQDKEIVFDEHMIVERRDHSIWMLIRARNGIFETISADGGKTWTKPAYSAIPHINARFFIRRLASGNILLVRHQTPAESGLTRKRIDGKLQSDRSHLIACLSTDEGRTWTDGLLVDPRREVSYPDADQLADGAIVLIYDYARKTHREICLARFTEADLQNPAATLPTPVVINSAPARKNLHPSPQ